MAKSRLMALVCLVAIAGGTSSAAAEFVLGPAELDRVTAGQSDVCTNCHFEPPEGPTPHSRAQARLIQMQAIINERISRLLVGLQGRSPL